MYNVSRIYFLYMTENSSIFLSVKLSLRLIGEWIGYAYLFGLHTMEYIKLVIL